MRWTLIATGHTQGYAQCELCGHVPIRRLFWIAPIVAGGDDGEDIVVEADAKMIGSECAQNYARVDLVQAYMRRLERRQAEVRREHLTTERDAERQRQREERDAERREWARHNADVVAWLGVQHHLLDRRRISRMNDIVAECGDSPPWDNFLLSLAEQVRNQAYLTPGQTLAVRNNMEQFAPWWNGLRSIDRILLRGNTPSDQMLSNPGIVTGIDVPGLLEDIDTGIVTSELGRNIAPSNVNTVDMLGLGMLAPETDEPATKEDAPGILNGRYTLSTGFSEHHYQIYTVQRSRSAPDLVGKRIIKAYDNESGDYKGFAYLTKSGHVRVWRRMMPRVNEPVYQYASTLMAILREMPIQQRAERYGREYNERRWTITRLPACRYCNSETTSSIYGVCPAHVSAATAAGGTRNRDVDVALAATEHTEHTSYARERARRSNRRSEQAERRITALLLDELGQGEVR